MSDISDKKVKSTIGFLNIEADACRGDGRPFAANTFTSVANMLGALRAALTAAEATAALFDECAIARDSVGFLGTVPQCIEYLNDALTAEQAKNAHARDDEWAKRLIKYARTGPWKPDASVEVDANILTQFLASEQSK